MKKIFPALILAAVSVFTFSCIKETGMGGDTALKPGAAQVVLRLKTPDGFSQVKSRSLSYAEENTIDNIFVLVFDKTNTLVAIEQGANVTSSAGHTNPAYSGEGSFSVTLESSKTTVDTYNLVVLANAQTILNNTIGFDVSAIGSKSYSSVMTSLQDQLSGPMYPAGGTIPMWGESGQTVIEPGTANRTLQLTRSVARIDVGVGHPTKNSSTDAWTWDGKDAASATIPFELAHVYVFRPNNRYAVAPDASKAAGEPTVPTGTTAFSVAASEANFGFAATASATGGFTSRDIYVPEADILMGASAKPGDQHHTDRMAIIVGGYFNGSATETFYRLDFAVNKDLVNVLRNHLYQFNIFKVTGGGYPDPETAYNSLAMNMAVDIYEWNETEMGEIVFDGQFMLSVSKGEFNISKDAADYTTDVKTDVPGGWKATTTDSWITFPGDDSGLPTEGKKTLTFHVTQNNDGADRTGTIKITAGRLEYLVKVVQSTKAAIGIDIINEWNNPITELVFSSAVNVQPNAQSFTVNWQPMVANLDIANSAVGLYAFPFFSGAPLTGTEPGGTGTKVYTIQPPAMTPAELSGNPFFTKMSKIDFTTTDGSEYVSKTIYLRQFVANTTTNEKDFYMLDNTTYSFVIKSSTKWVITAVDDPDGILAADSPVMLGRSGGHNTTTGESISFKFIDNSATGTKNGKIVTLTLTDPTGKMTPVAVILKGITCGVNGVAVKQLIGTKEYLTHTYGGKCWMVENLKQGTKGTANNQAVAVYFGQGGTVDASSANPGIENDQYYYTATQAANICPEGWHLPTSAEVSALLAAANTADRNTNPVSIWWCGNQASANGAFAGDFVISTGRWYSWSTVGNWWYGTGGQYFNGAPTGMNALSSANHWFSVRCVQD